MWYLPNEFARSNMLLIEVKEILVAGSLYKKEGINYEETLTLGSKVHFLQNYHGSFFHDEVKKILP